VGNKRTGGEIGCVYIGNLARMNKATAEEHTHIVPRNKSHLTLPHCTIESEPTMCSISAKHVNL